MIPWTETDEPATTPPPEVRYYWPAFDFKPGQWVHVDGEDYPAEITTIYQGYATLVTGDNELIHRPLYELSRPFCAPEMEQASQAGFDRAMARLQALQQAGCPLVVTEPCDSQEDDSEGLAGFVVGYILAALIWLSPLALLLWIGVEAARRW